MCMQVSNVLSKEELATRESKVDRIKKLGALPVGDIGRTRDITQALARQAVQKSKQMAGI